MREGWRTVCNDEILDAENDFSKASLCTVVVQRVVVEWPSDSDQSAIMGNRESTVLSEIPVQSHEGKNERDESCAGWDNDDMRVSV